MPEKEQPLAAEVLVVKTMTARVLTGIIMVLFVGSTTAIVNHETRIGRIEESRFTNSDAHELERRMLHELPPKWLQEDLREIKDTLKGLDERLDKIEKAK